MRRCDSAAIVPKTSELLPEPETPVNTVSRRFGSSTLTSLRLLTRAPCTRITSRVAAARRGLGVVGVAEPEPQGERDEREGGGRAEQRDAEAEAAIAVDR